MGGATAKNGTCRATCVNHPQPPQQQDPATTTPTSQGDKIKQAQQDHVLLVTGQIATFTPTVILL